MTRKVPELNLRQYTDGTPDARSQFSQDLMRGLKDYGFIILSGHNVPLSLLDAAYSECVSVFAKSADWKRKHQGGLRGYTQFGKEHAKGFAVPDLKEFWQIGPETTANDSLFPPNVWPHDAPTFQTVFQDLFNRLSGTGRILLEALTPELDLPRTFFNDKIDHGPSLLRLLHYPAIPPDADPKAVRAAAHEDINFLTLMVAAKGSGLELLDRDGRWLPVLTEPKNLIVNAGDMLARLTNDVIPATTHRVVNPTGPNISRYSMPFFLHPNNEMTLECLPSCSGARAKYAAITAGEFLAERLKEIGLNAS